MDPADAGAQAAAARRDVNPDTVASIVLGGGAGTRLFPLTRTRAKPAVMTLVLPLSIAHESHFSVTLFIIAAHGAGLTDNRDARSNLCQLI